MYCTYTYTYSHTSSAYYSGSWTNLQLAWRDHQYSSESRKMYKVVSPHAATPVGKGARRAEEGRRWLESSCT
jgi:hypothetical protein